MKTLSMFLLASVIGLFFVGCVTAGIPRVGPDEQNPALQDVTGLIDNFPTDFASVKVKGTCNPFKTKLSYNMVNDHVQGVSRIGDHFILAQSTGNNVRKMEKFLLVSGDSGGKCYFNFVGTTFPHCGGIQASGKILAVAAESRYGGGGPGPTHVVTGMLSQTHQGSGSEALFFDLSDPAKPVRLPVTIPRPNQNAGAAGIAYHPQHGCHYVVVYDKGAVDLYKSNGMSLRSPDCQFSQVANFKAPGASGGGTNLLVEDTGRLYLIGMTQDKEDYGVLTLGEIKNPGHAPEFEKVLVKKLSKSEGSMDAGFRWGGGIVVRNSQEIDILAAQRTLCHLANPTRVKVWTNRQWVGVRHRGWYVAKFYVNWTENGVSKSWKSGKVAAVPKNPVVGSTFERVIELPANARNITLNVQAMTGRLGKKAWKHVIKSDIKPRQTYEVYGTVFKPKWKAF
jgi:hypothetical protein